MAVQRKAVVTRKYSRSRIQLEYNVCFPLLSFECECDIPIIFTPSHFVHNLLHDPCPRVSSDEFFFYSVVYRINKKVKHNIRIDGYQLHFEIEMIDVLRNFTIRNQCNRKASCLPVRNMNIEGGENTLVIGCSLKFAWHIFRKPVCFQFWANCVHASTDVNSPNWRSCCRWSIPVCWRRL